MMQRLGFFPYSKKNIKKMWHREIASQWISQLRTKQALEQREENLPQEERMYARHWSFPKPLISDNLLLYKHLCRYRKAENLTHTLTV